jgi:hypothetical protein
LNVRAHVVNYKFSLLLVELLFGYCLGLLYLRNLRL